MVAPISAEEKRAGFFAIGRDSFIAASNLGINEAAAFVVLARGSGRDNVTTKWSADAISGRIGVRWTTAKNALNHLVESEVVTVVRGSTRPAYLLARYGDLIWLPNSVIDGDGPNAAPVTLLRQTQDQLLLRLFVELYWQQNLREDGGVSRNLTSMPYSREKMAQRGRWTAWRFFDRAIRAAPSHPVVRAHFQPEVPDAERAAGKHEWSDYFRRFSALVSLGLMDWVPYLFEGPQGEPIHPHSWMSDVGSEAELHEGCEAAALSIMPESQIARFKAEGGELAAVASHIAEVQLIAIGRLSHRPATRLTSAWGAEAEDKARQYIGQYQQIIEVSKRSRLRRRPPESVGRHQG